MTLAPLPPGSRVALVATAGPTPPEQLERAQELLRSWGLDPVAFPSTTGRHPRAAYLAAPDDVRARDLEDAWCDPDLDAVFCLRGGYGTVRILDRLDEGRMRAARSTPLFGSSDVTALHEWLRERLGAPTWFTPMIGTASLLDDEVAVTSLRQAVTEGVVQQRISGEEAEVIVAGTAHGPLAGGNLSLVAMTLGARGRVVDNTGTIVLLEDVDEDTYRIDGYLTSLLRSGWFEGVVGVVLGSWFRCGPLPEIRELALELLAPLGIPVAWGVDVGHAPGSLSVPLGVPMELRVEAGDVSLTPAGFSARAE